MRLVPGGEGRGRGQCRAVTGHGQTDGLSPSRAQRASDCMASGGLALGRPSPIGRLCGTARRLPTGVEDEACARARARVFVARNLSAGCAAHRLSVPMGLRMPPRRAAGGGWRVARFSAIAGRWAESDAGGAGDGAVLTCAPSLWFCPSSVASQAKRGALGPAPSVRQMRAVKVQGRVSAGLVSLPEK